MTATSPAMAISSAVTNAITSRRLPREFAHIVLRERWDTPGGRVRSSTSVHMPAHRPSGPDEARHPRASRWLGWGGRGAPRFTRPHACPAGGGPTWRDRDPRAPAQALQGAPRRHRRRGGTGRGRPRRRRAPSSRPPTRRSAARRARGRRRGRRRSRHAEPPKPVRPEVAAALRRKKIPYWAMPVLARPAPLGLRVPGHPRAAARRRGRPRRPRRGALRAAAPAATAPAAAAASAPRFDARARDLARLPRPHGVGAPRLRRLAGATPTAPPDKPQGRRHAGLRRRCTDAGARPGRPLRAGPRSAGSRRPARSTSQLVAIAEGETDLRGGRARPRRPRRPASTPTVTRRRADAVAGPPRPADWTR